MTSKKKTGKEAELVLENKRLEKENAKLKLKLRKAEAMLELQKKAHEIMGVPTRNFVRVASLAVTSLTSYLMLHVTFTISHTILSAEVASCACLGKPRAQAST